MNDLFTSDQCIARIVQLHCPDYGVYLQDKGQIRERQMSTTIRQNQQKMAVVVRQELWGTAALYYRIVPGKRPSSCKSPPLIDFDSSVLFQGPPCNHPPCKIFVWWLESSQFELT